MGQYYVPLIIRENDLFKGGFAHDFGNGLKLLEHSYIGNNFVNAITHELLDNPGRLAWIGDYAAKCWYPDLEDKRFSNDFICSQDMFNLFFTIAWKIVSDTDKDLTQHRITEEVDFIDKDHLDYYIVNLTWGIYFSVKEYYELCESKSIYGVVHPLPLLCACGNGYGGGDYYTKGINADKVGSWAFDEIVITQTEPTDKRKIDVHTIEFIEGPIM